MKKKKVSSLTVLKTVLKILPDDLLYLISKYHGRWIHYFIPSPMKVKYREPRNRLCRKKHFLSTAYY
jgi:hypothetical protein